MSIRASITILLTTLVVLAMTIPKELMAESTHVSFWLVILSAGAIFILLYMQRERRV